MNQTMNSPDEARDKFPANYSSKSGGYFSGARHQFVDDLPGNPSARLLEIGCSAGNTAAYAMAQGKCGWCCGVELCPGPAAEAAKKMDRVIVGDVEKLELHFPPKSFDVLFLSEVLEHLVDPSAVLSKLRGLLKPGALVMAGSPNVCHQSVLRMLLKGRWDYQSQGIMDATHLRWFSPSTYREMFESCGFIVDEVASAWRLGRKAQVFNYLTGRRLEHLLHSQIYLKAHCPL
jgi:2-polyprenyl-3-methyl-5-hydroxy-6-metoxy-1,4-benzoquinol methylase